MNRGTSLKRMPVWIGVVSLIAAAVGADMSVGKDIGTSTLWYEQPANSWMTEALPIGNGPMGAMLFGGTDIERIQFNEISLWSGDRIAQRDKSKKETWEPIRPSVISSSVSDMIRQG